MKSYLIGVLLTTAALANPAAHKPFKTKAKTERIEINHKEKNLVFNHFSSKMKCEKLEYTEERADNEDR